MTRIEPSIISCDAALFYPFLEVVQDFAVVVADGVIVDRGGRAEIIERWPDARREPTTGNLMIPGLVNAHDHGRGVDSLRQGVPDDTLEVWLKDLSRSPQLPPYETALLEGLLLASSGVVWTVHSHLPRNWEDPLPEIEATLRGYRDAGVGVAFHWPFVEQNLLYYESEEAKIQNLPGPARDTARSMAEPPPLKIEEYLSLCDDVYREYHSYDDGILVQAGPAGAQWCADDSIGSTIEWAESRQTRAHMHLLESRRQVEFANRAFGSGYITHLDAEGLLSPVLTLAHVVWATAEELELLGSADVAVAHNPSSNIRLGSGIAPVDRMIDSGIPVGCGMDGLSLELDHDHLRELRLAHSLSCLAESTGTSKRLSSAAILTMGTRWGMLALAGLERGGTYARLAVGEPADIALLRVDDRYLDLPDDRLATDMLLATATRDSVTDLFRRGAATVRGGQPVNGSPNAVSELLETYGSATGRTPELEVILKSLR